jgi:nicotinamide-nucleotide amidase
MNSRPPRALIISQGEELLTGQTVDTNSTFLAGQLTALGLRVVGATTAGDRLDSISEAFSHAIEKADVVVCTGGLGPTTDDLTAAGVGSALGLQLAVDLEALEQVRQRYADRQRVMASCNEKQAILPDTAEILINPLGTAPGFTVTSESGCRIFCLPGVPHEMRRMWLEEVRPKLLDTLPLPTIQRHLYRTMGKGESQLQELLGGVPESFPGVVLGFRARSPENQVKLEATEDCSSFDQAVVHCRELLGIDSFSEDESVSLAGTIGNLLCDREQRLALAESCTGGWIGHLCVSEPGSSQWLDRGAVTYSNQAKIEMIGVAPELLQQHGAVSEQVALAMARGTAQAAQVSWGLAVTGIAGPSGGSPEKPVGTVYVAVSGPETSYARKLFLPTKSRTMTRQFSAYLALDILRRQLLRQKS